MAHTIGSSNLQSCLLEEALVSFAVIYIGEIEGERV